VSEADRLYSQFRNGQWIAAAALENADLRKRVIEHRVVWSVKRHSFVINEPFTCERL
jgi:hypothetical protein